MVLTSCTNWFDLTEGYLFFPSGLIFIRGLVSGTKGKVAYNCVNFYWKLLYTLDIGEIPSMGHYPLEHKNHGTCDWAFRSTRSKVKSIKVSR